MLSQPAVRDAVLEVEDLSVEYGRGSKRVTAVDGLSFSLRRGQILALVGESGCGKTTTALAMMGLLPHPGRIVRGEVRFGGRDLLTLRGEEQRRFRGSEISMIFQEPVSGLNPVVTIGQQVEEIITAHQRVSKREARTIVQDALVNAGLAQPEQVTSQYPFQLSGGMCQRVLIAIATVLRPQVIIADEPTSALDVTVQAGILSELKRLQQEQGISILLITHDLGVVAHMADEVVVMYAGRVAEYGPVGELFRRPRHPYTWSLLNTLPRLNQPTRPLEAIKGVPPDMAALQDECAFLPRCKKAVNACRTSPSPPLEELSSGHRTACYNPIYQPEE